MTAIERGEIWWANLPEPVGSEPGYRRPVLIVQAALFNASRIRTVIAIAVTSNLELSDAPGNVLLPSAASGLPRDSVANVSQLVTLDRTRLAEQISMVSPRWMVEIDAGLRLVLGL